MRKDSTKCGSLIAFWSGFFIANFAKNKNGKQPLQIIPHSHHFSPVGSNDARLQLF